MTMHRGKCGNCTCGRQKQYESRDPLRRSREVIKRKLTMMQSFAMSIASRGFRNKKTDIPTKQLRTLSCFGDKSIDGALPVCEGLGESDVEEGKFYCKDCGCGDKPSTWLHSTDDKYSKLDYPSLNCPRNMPGFSNYQPSKEKDGSRKYIIENYDPKQLVKIRVSAPSNEEI